MRTLAEVKRYVDSFSRPSGYNVYAWNVAKKTAMEAWYCYLNGIRFRKPINYFCREFYDMLKTPEGQYIVPQSSFRSFA